MRTKVKSTAQPIFTVLSLFSCSVIGQASIDTICISFHQATSISSRRITDTFVHQKLIKSLPVIGSTFGADLEANIQILLKMIKVRELTGHLVILASRCHAQRTKNEHSMI